MNELVAKTQEGILNYANDYVRTNHVIVSKTYDLPTAMNNLFLQLVQTTDKNDKPALEVCSKESIQEAIMTCINKELDVGKKQGYFIVYNGNLTFQPSYFGNVKQAKSVSNVRIVSNVIRDGEEAELETRVDGTIIVRHKPNIKCLNNKIIAVYAVATDIDTGRVDNSDIMSVEEAKKSWLKSQNGCKVGKEFEHEMLRRTIENRLAKHYINKADDSEKIFITDANGNEIRVTNYDDLPQIDCDYTINTEEQINHEKEKYVPAEDDILTADDLRLETIEEQKTEIPEGAIEISYKEFKDNEDKYEMVKGSWNEKTRTIFVIKK